MKKKTKEIPVKLKNTPGWRRTNDVLGHEPTFKIHCWRCKAIKGERIEEIKKIVENGVDDKEKLKLLTEWFKSETMPMALRHSDVSMDEDDPENAVALHRFAYKCPRCAWFTRFHVVDDVEYLNKVYEWRGKKTRFIPSVDNWSEEHAEIGRQLEALGYWGGN